MQKLILAVIIALAATAVSAETLTWKVRSHHPNVVSLSFYSQDRNAAWPGDGQVYLLPDSEVHTYTQRCVAGETICYGAWVRNRDDLFWGVGRDNAKRCSNCCYVCDGGTTSIRNLNP